jgi:hypothetical protein
MNDEFRAIVERNRQTVRNAEFEADTVFSHLIGLESSDFIGATGNDLLVIRSLLQLSVDLIDKLAIADVAMGSTHETYCTDEKAFVPYHGCCNPAIVGTEDEGKAEDCATGAEVIRIHKEWCTDEDCEPYDLRCAVNTSGKFDILKW